MIDRVQDDFDRVRARVREAWTPWIERHLHFEDGFTLLARIDGNLAGVLSLRFREESEGFIDILDVLAPFRRRGVARALVTRCAGLCRARGADSVAAWSSSEKSPVLALWRDMGFAMEAGTITSARTGERVDGYFVSLAL